MSRIKQTTKSQVSEAFDYKPFDPITLEQIETEQAFFAKKSLQKQDTVLFRMFLTVGSSIVFCHTILWVALITNAYVPTPVLMWITCALILAIIGVLITPDRVRRQTSQLSFLPRLQKWGTLPAAC